MSLESIYRAVSHAYKAASEASGGTAEEQSALDVLGGLSALLESRIHLHKQASSATTTTPTMSTPAAKPKLPAGVPASAPTAAPAAGAAKPRTPGDSGEYELR